MPVTPNDFLNSAIFLIKHSKEMDYRNAASRAYYCAYHNAEAEAKAKKLPAIHYPLGKRPGVHQVLIDKFKNHPKPIYQQIGILLQQCKSFRTKADYYLHHNFTSTNAQNTIHTVKQITALLHPSRIPVTKHFSQNP
jgi:uncharacterized protein (UPF0332 family)